MKFPDPSRRRVLPNPRPVPYPSGHMLKLLSTFGLRTRLAYTDFLKRLGFGENGFLLPLAVLIGIVTAVAAVAFHELIVWIRTVLYLSAPADVLYGKGVLLLLLFP